MTQPFLFQFTDKATIKLNLTSIQHKKEFQN